MQGVELTVANEEGVVLGPLATGGDGRFDSELDPGTYHLRLHRIGYAPHRTDDFVAAEGEVVELALEMEPRAIRLDPLEIVGEGRERGRAAFERRRELYDGAFMDPIHVALMEAPTPTDILARTPGLIADFHEGVRSLRSRCLHIFLDDIPAPMGPGRLNELVRARNVRAVEAYRNITEVPDEIRDGYRWPYIGNDCGVVQIWTTMSW